MKSLVPGPGTLLVVGLLLSAGNIGASAQERLPWLREAPQSERTYAQSGDVDRGALPPAQGTEPGPGPSYERSDDNAPRSGASGYSRGDDRYHPPAQQGGGFGASAERSDDQEGPDDRRARGDERDGRDEYVPPVGRQPYDSRAAERADNTYRPPARDDTYGSRPVPSREETYRSASPYQGPGRIEPYDASRSYDAPRSYGQDDAYRPPSRDDRGQDRYQASPAPYPSRRSDEPEWRDDRGRPQPPDRYASAAPPYDDREPPPSDGTYSMREIVDTGHGFFGSVSRGLASVIEYSFRTQGRPNGYILGEDVGGAFVAGLRYGEGRLYTRDAGTHRVFWQGPSLGYDAGAEGSKVMVLIYNLRSPSNIYERFGGVAGSAYVVGGVGVTFQQRNDIVLAPIRAGVGFRLGANVGYLKYTRRPTWNPF